MIVVEIIYDSIMSYQPVEFVIFSPRDFGWRDRSKFFFNQP